MRAVFGVVSLLVVLVIIGFLAKTQLGGQVRPAATNSSGVSVPVVTPGTTPQQQSQQVQEQFKQSLEGALQQARPMPDDSK
jgi:multidrug efflux pump subunit AcrB